MNDRIEQLGQYTIEHKGIATVIVTSDKDFNAVIDLEDCHEYSIPTIKTGNKYALNAMALTKSMKLTLSAEGHEDVVIDGRTKEEHE